MVSVTTEPNAFISSESASRNNPWVTVICICYNQQAYVAQALRSVVDQCYPNVELIIIDNGSSDGSASIISNFSRQYPAIRFIANAANLGLNRAFNQGLALAGGQYIIDLSADDMLLPSRIARQVALFETLADTYGVVFSNAAYINASGQQTGVHYLIDTAGRACTPVPTGSVFREILASYFICTPTMMMRRDVLNHLDGYDETLSYEDFDFWVRSARLYQYAYLDEVLTLKRQLPDSMSAQVAKPNNDLLRSSLVVCQKAFHLCATPDEFRALANRLQTFIRKAFYAGQFALAGQFGNLLHQIRPPDFMTRLVLVLSRLRVPVNRLYRYTLRWRFERRSAKLL